MSWIKIEDKLPKAAQEILFTDGKTIYKGWLETTEPLEDLMFYNESWNARGDDSWPANISHWKKLPSLPKKE